MSEKPDFNLPTLKHYSEEEAWNFLREFDKTSRSVRQNQLKYNQERLNYLCIFACNLNRVTLNILRDQIALLELTFNHTILYQPNKESSESQITYYTDSENEEEA